MRTNIKTNVDAIAQGMIELHHEKGSSGPLAFGMLDAELMEILKKQLKGKVVEIIPAPSDLFSKKELNELPEDLRQNMDSLCLSERDAWVEKTETEIIKAIYRLATESGAMVV